MPEGWEYCSPEVLHGTEFTAASDAYAFGIMLFEVFAELPAFSTKQPRSASVASTSGRAPRQSVVKPRSQLEVMNGTQGPLAPHSDPHSVASAIQAAAFIPTPCAFPCLRLPARLSPKPSPSADDLAARRRDGPKQAAGIS